MKKRLLYAKTICFVCILALLHTTAFSQTRQTVSGIVSDINGNPVVGAMVVEKDTYNGTASDEFGRYTLKIAGEDAVLVFSMMGYTSREVNARGGTTLDVTLENSDITIDAVVKVAYGVQKRESITGAISSIGARELDRNSAANITNALAGRIAGLTALQTGGSQPGYDNSVFYLRGIGTTDASRSTPLIMIDGVPRDNMSDLNPDEVESISVLKDASATAVFGVRGANGVILITTRRGTAGKTQLSLSFDQTYTGFTKRPARLHSLDYLELRNQALENSGTMGGFDPEYIDMFKNPLLGLDPASPNYDKQVQTRMFMYPDHDSYADYVKKWAPQTKVSANISGGMNRLAYFINVGYVHQGSNFYTDKASQSGFDPEMKLDRLNIRSNLDFQFSKSVKAFLNVASYIEDVNMPNMNVHTSRENFIRTVLQGVTTRLPITPGYVTIPGYGVEAGKVVKEPYFDWPPYMMINRLGYRQDNNTNLNTTLGAEWDLSTLITKGLSIKGQLSYDLYSGTLLNGAYQELIYDPSVDSVNDELQFLSNDRYNDRRLSLTRSHRSRYTFNAQASINYLRSFGKNNVSALVLVQRDYWETEQPNLPFNVVGLVGRATYDYDQRYFAEFNMGYNGSEQFAPDNRFGFFPAFSLGWVVTNEGFMEGAKDVLGYLKIRGSWGQVGNDKIGDTRFLYIDNITLGDPSRGHHSLASLGQGKYVNEAYIGNNRLQWEVSTKMNLGIDFELFRGLNGTFDIFTENREKILISRQSVPYFQGVVSSAIPRVNMGEVTNRGFELELSYERQFTKDFWARLHGNMSYSKNKVTFYDEIVRDESYAMKYERTGYAVDQQRGYLIDRNSNGGFWTSQEEIDASGLTYDFGTPRPGDFKYVDVTQDGIIDTRDIVPIGYSSSIPRYNYGFGLDLNWKGLDFSVFFQGVSKYSNYYGAAVFETFTTEGTYWGYTRKAWTPARRAAGEEITYPTLSTGANTNHVANSFFIMDRSFLRLKNLEIGYTLPKKWMEKLWISQFRIYVSGQNLFIWDKIKADHVDPEMNNAMDYPITRMISFGCDLKF